MAYSIKGGRVISLLPNGVRLGGIRVGVSPNGNYVTVDGITVTMNGEPVVITATPNTYATVNGITITVNSDPVVIT